MKLAPRHPLYGPFVSTTLLAVPIAAVTNLAVAFTPAVRAVTSGTATPAATVVA